MNKDTTKGKVPCVFEHKGYIPGKRDMFDVATTRRRRKITHRGPSCFYASVLLLLWTLIISLDPGSSSGAWLGRFSFCTSVLAFHETLSLTTRSLARNQPLSSLKGSSTNENENTNGNDEQFLNGDGGASNEQDVRTNRIDDFKNDILGHTVNPKSTNGSNDSHLQKLQTNSRQLAEIRKSWKKTFEEIKALVVPETPLKQKRKEMRAKIVDRFDGFADWERRLQLWADDVSEYIDRNWQPPSDLQGKRYLMSRYGADEATTKPTKRDGKESADTAEVSQQDLNNTLLSTSPLKEDLFHRYSPTADVTSQKLNEASTGRKKSKDIPFPELSFPVVPAPAAPGEPVLPHTDVSDKSKKIYVVTTAALPWMTGTAVNPLLRAAYLTRGRRNAGGSATILLPWLERDDDHIRVYGEGKDGGRKFATQEEQELHIRDWLRNTAGMKEAAEELRIRWYTAWQERAENSIYSMGDITALIPVEEADICVLEEPEHLNWYRAPGDNWTDKFKHVVGIVHTNYFVYAQEQPAAFIRAPAMRLLASWMCRVHCHRVIKLSGTLGVFAPEKELIQNVHGVRQTFIDIGQDVSKRIKKSRASVNPAEEDHVFGASAEPSVYFIGKMLWSKGLGSLMELMKYAEESAGLKCKIDMYGGGPDQDEARRKSVRLELDMPFHGPVDHAELGLSHKIFINPSTSEVLCTTAAEALAMGKFVILPSHPSNDFFVQFPNCLTYASKEEFVGNLYYALTHSPQPMTKESSYALSWEAGMERFEAAAAISVAEAEAMQEVLKEGLKIDLPPLIESEERRNKIAKTLRTTRERYRTFRSRLSQEIQEQNLLPVELQERLVKELDKRLDIDFDQMLSSQPKLRLQLSPAELDKRLLDLYNTVSEGPRGDVLRVIGGGTDVGKQYLYLKKQAIKARAKNGERDGDQDSWQDDIATLLVPLDETRNKYDDSPLTASERVRKTLRRNLLKVQRVYNENTSPKSSTGEKRLASVEQNGVSLEDDTIGESIERHSMFGRPPQSSTAHFRTRYSENRLVIPRGFPLRSCRNSIWSTRIHAPRLKPRLLV